jgi:hypothetical protein
MRDSLAKLIAVKGVRGVAVADFSGTILEIAGSLDAPTMSGLFAAYVQVVERAIHADGRAPPLSLCAQFEGGRVILEQHGDRYLAVVADREAQILMLNAARGFLGSELRNRNANDEVPQQRTAVVGTSGLAVPGTVGTQVVQHISTTLERHLGARARFLLQDELTKMGATPQTLRFEQVADLLQAASVHIPNPTAQAQFISEALGDTP